MASSGRVTVTAEDIAGSGDTMQGALSMWIVKYGPIDYNKFQSVYFSLKREHHFVDPDVEEGDTQQTRQQRMMALYRQLHAEVWGPDWAAALGRPPARTDGEDGTVANPGRLGGPSAPPPQVPDNAVVQHHSIGSPRRDPPSPATGSPDVVMLRQDIAEVLDEYETSHSELSEEFQERMVRLGDGLRDLPNATTEHIYFAVRVQGLMRDYRQGYQNALNSGQLVGQDEADYARAVLDVMDGETFQEEDDLKQHIHALGKLSGMSAIECREYGKTLWNRSPQATPPKVAEAPRVSAATDKSPESVYESRQRSPGDSHMSLDVVNVMGKVAEGFERTMAATLEKVSEIAVKNSGGDDNYAQDRINAVSMTEFRPVKPTIEDTDPDMDKYDREFWIMVACYGMGSRKPKPLEQLNMYGKGFKPGSTRYKVFHNKMREAMTAGRIPDDAEKVLKEVQVKLRDYIWETNLQKLTRLDQEYQALCQGAMNHAEFRCLFESKLQDMTECENYEMPSESVLYRNYLCKLRPDLKSEVMRKEWKVDGPTNPPRPTATWRDVAKAVGLLLEERSDIDAARVAVGDSILNVDSVRPFSVPQAGAGSGKQGPLVCNLCHREGHYAKAVSYTHLTLPTKA